MPDDPDRDKLNLRVDRLAKAMDAARAREAAQKAAYDARPGGETPPDEATEREPAAPPTSAPPPE